MVGGDGWWWVVGGGGWGLHSHFHVQPNYSVEVVLHCVDVGVVTKNSPLLTRNGEEYDVSTYEIISNN